MGKGGGRERGQRRSRFRPFIHGWWRDWRGHTVVIVASGPSAADIELGKAQGRARVLTINESWRLAPWADALYACDGAWWKARGGVPEFAGLKLSHDPKAAKVGADIHQFDIKAQRDEILTDRAGLIGDGGNSGFQALNVAVQFGAKRIALVGYDMRLDRGIHWHGRHARGLNNPSPNHFGRWRRALDRAADRLADLGIEVLNLSPVSTLTAYRFATIDEVVGC